MQELVNKIDIENCYNTRGSS